MKWVVAALMALLAWRATATTAYVSDELILGVYSEENNQGQRLATLHSGASLDALAQSGEFTQVRLNDGTLGWVKSAYLTSKQPATMRVKQLEEELDRSRATTPALAEAAARNEVDKLKRELALAQSVGTPTPADLAAPPGADSRLRADNAGTRGGLLWWLAVGAVPIAAGAGYWFGYATLARRVRNKFGGIKVY